ncbi:MAG: hypothetical protein UV20_C0009G0028 [Candidatus Magasanikbacteria bacterium GW2011_GWA2_42_32]|uniref:Uncharacterized protein n=1 Tax=Candidatus Magasanikbacteria bacterium GW2011_GWA2_42_32 TaxID=1619039 RepID=A0A0G1A6H6_9BACT|nr:MAG: hypothetical protein UV20_C0009G0028 [Candidatus Magasanikbacteria bacterium GW2011_GWA2_42_32]HBX15897.1 hypothetical protein [Candidatus Magasanikbacteria bacterium]
MPLATVGIINSEIEADPPSRGDSTVTRAYLQSGSALVLTKLASVAGIDLKTAGQITLIASALANTIITKAVLIITAADTATVMPTLRIGRAPNYDQFIPATLIHNAMNAMNNYQMFIPSITCSAFAAADAIKLDITIGSTATTHTATVELWGYVLPPV